MEFIRAIQCYSCFVWGEHLRNECPTKNNPICSNCSTTGHSYTECTNISLCSNCEGPHSATARVCPAYNTAMETLKPKLAIQLAHYITNINSSLTPTHNNAIATEILRKAALTANNIDDFVVSLFRSCDILINTDTDTGTSTGITTGTTTGTTTGITTGTTTGTTTSTQAQQQHTPQQHTPQQHTPQQHTSQQHPLQQQTLKQHHTEHQHSHQQHSLKNPYQSQKMTTNRYCADISKHLTRKSNSTQLAHATTDFEGFETSGATARTDQTMSILRNNITDTDSNFGDVSSLDISNDDLLSETYSFTNPFIGHDLSLEDLEWEDMHDTHSHTSPYTRHNLSLEDTQPHALYTSDIDAAKYYYLNKMGSSKTDEERKYYHTELLNLFFSKENRDHLSQYKKCRPDHK